MGRLFQNLGFALVLAAAGWGARAGCVMQQLAELPVKTVGTEVLIDAQINGQPVKMVVDTGSEDTLLIREGAKRLNLPLISLWDATTYGAGGADVAQRTRVKEFRVGNLVARDEPMIVTGRNDMGAEGLLGANFLLQADIEFDLPEGKIRFFEPKNCSGDQVVYWGKAYSVAPMFGASTSAINVKVTVNGVSLWALMDSGASTTVLTTGGAAKAGVTSNSPGVTPNGYIIGIGGAHAPLYTAVFSSFGFGDEAISNAKLSFADMFRTNTTTDIKSNVPQTMDEPQMLLGADFFQAHRIYVSMKQRKVYASYMGGPVFETRQGAAEADSAPPPPGPAASPPK